MNSGEHLNMYIIGKLEKISWIMNNFDEFLKIGKWHHIKMKWIYTKWNYLPSKHEESASHDAIISIPWKKKKKKDKTRDFVPNQDRNWAKQWTILFTIQWMRCHSFWRSYFWKIKHKKPHIIQIEYTVMTPFLGGRNIHRKGKKNNENKKRKCKCSNYRLFVCGAVRCDSLSLSGKYETNHDKMTKTNIIQII